MKEFLTGILILMTIQLFVMMFPVFNFWHLVSAYAFWGVMELKYK